MAHDHVTMWPWPVTSHWSLTIVLKIDWKNKKRKENKIEFNLCIFNKLLFYEPYSVIWLMSYGNWILNTSCRGHVSKLLLEIPSSHGLGVLLRVSDSLYKCSVFCWRLLLVILLTILPFPTSFLFEVYDSCKLSIGSQTSLFRRLFITSILSWYTIDEALESINNYLELTLLEKADLSLIMSMFMSMSIVNGKWAIYKGCIVVVEVENSVFTNSLMGAIMKYSGKRERSNVRNCH